QRLVAELPVIGEIVATRRSSGQCVTGDCAICAGVGGHPLWVLIIIAYEVYDQLPRDADLLIAAIETHEAKLGCTPRPVGPQTLPSIRPRIKRQQQPGVSSARVSPIARPRASSGDANRWFRNGQKWRTGSEGRISVVKRRHRLNRGRYKGDDCIRRCLGV